MQIRLKIKSRLLRRQCGIIIALAGLMLAACGVVDPRGGSQGDSRGFAGGAAADEPQAAKIAEDVLLAGGTAADAAVALYFTLAVTYPVAAGLGSGGVCLVYSSSAGGVEVLEFPLLRPAAGGLVAIPGTVRAMSALHARYGQMRWERLVAPSEQVARFGFPLSRALANGFISFSDKINGRENLFEAIVGRSGAVIREGYIVKQLALSETLSTIRMRGGGDLYTGLLALKFVEVSDRMGGKVSISELGDYIPVWKVPGQIAFGDMTMYTVNSWDGEGALARMWSMLTEGDRFSEADVEERPHLMIEISKLAYNDRSMDNISKLNRSSWEHARSLMQTYDKNSHILIYDAPEYRDATNIYPGPSVPGGDGITSFVVGDSSGTVVGCVITMNGPFGVGKMDFETGIIPAGLFNSELSVTNPPDPMIVVRHHSREVILAMAASGGRAASSTIAQTTAGTLLDRRTFGQAIRMPRLFHDRRIGQVLFEPETSVAVLDSLIARGHEVKSFSPLGFVNGMYCPRGLGKEPYTCMVYTDPRGFGLSVGVSD